jgi:hypothetical protein
MTVLPRLILLALLPCGTLAAAAPVPATPGAAPRVFLLNGDHLRDARDRLRGGDAALAPALRKLERDARAAMNAGPFSVTC